MKSMTGMGRAVGVVLGTPTRIEIRSINHRFSEVSTRVPTRYLMLEIPIQKFIREHLTRGKIDVFLFEEKKQDLTEEDLQNFVSYHRYLKKICTSLNMSAESVEFKDVLSGVGSWVQKEIDVDKVWKELKPLLEKALQDLLKMREFEGKNLKQEFEARFAMLTKIRDQIFEQVKDINKNLQERLNKKISEKKSELADLDPQRLHTEVLYYLDRMDVSEELERIQSHLNQTQVFLKDKEPVGRKLDFLLQELNREFNTIASKSQSAEIAHIIVDAKSELEKIREQVQNIE